MFDGIGSNPFVSAHNQGHKRTAGLQNKKQIVNKHCFFCGKPRGETSVLAPRQTYPHFAPVLKETLAQTFLGPKLLKFHRKTSYPQKNGKSTTTTPFFLFNCLAIVVGPHLKQISLGGAFFEAGMLLRMRFPAPKRGEWFNIPECFGIFKNMKLREFA